MAWKGIESETSPNHAIQAFLSLISLSNLSNPPCMRRRPVSIYFGKTFRQNQRHGRSLRSHGQGKSEPYPMLNSILHFTGKSLMLLKTHYSVGREGYCVSQEQDDAIVGRMVREHVEAKAKLIKLRGEALELGQNFEELGRKLRKFSELIKERTRPESQESGLEKFFPSLGGLDTIKSYEQHLSKATYEAVAKWIAEIPETAKKLAELNEKLKPYDVR